MFIMYSKTLLSDKSSLLNIAEDNSGCVSICLVVKPFLYWTAFPYNEIHVHIIGLTLPVFEMQ